jgi:FKBP-type peptidyl-prolyl cis-trans isomerase FkpA
VKKILVVLIASASLFWGSCKDDDDPCTKEVSENSLDAVDKTRLKADSLAIVDYLNANSITGTEIKNNVRYRVTQLGTGATPCIESFIEVAYQGKLLKTGTIFDPPSGSTIKWEERFVTFPLTNLILGWKIVLPSMPEGTKLTLYIPSGYAYGPTGGANGAIPANANLIFDIEFVRIR